MVYQGPEGAFAISQRMTFPVIPDTETLPELSPPQTLVVPEVVPATEVCDTSTVVVVTIAGQPGTETESVYIPELAVVLDVIE